MKRIVSPLFGAFLLGSALLAVPGSGLLAAGNSIPADTYILTPRTFIEISKKVLPGVVSIEVKVPPSDKFLKEHGVESMEELWQKMQDGTLPDNGAPFFRGVDPGDFGFSGSGSGVVIEQKDGWAYAITNRHVLDEDDRAVYTVILDDSHGDEAHKIKGDEVEVVGSDELTDIAVLKFRIPKGVKIPTIKFTDSDKAEVGEWVVALGNPLDLNNSVSQGIVSAKNRDISRENRIEGLLQTTAVINPGNSGGPLVNLSGDIVGINNAIATNTGRWAGVGFAIPSNQASRVAKLLIENGKVTRGYLGIAMQDLEDKPGVTVSNVSPGTPAEVSGIQAGDKLIEVDGRKVKNTRSLLTDIGNRMAGDKVSLTVVREKGGKEDRKTVEVTLTERPSEAVLAERMADLSKSLAKIDGNAIEQLGLILEADQDGTFKGMRVADVKPRSMARKAGIAKGDLIVQINGVFTTSKDKTLEGIANVAKGASHVILFRRNGGNQFVTIEQTTPESNEQPKGKKSEAPADK